LEGVAWDYFTRALGWARKYGIRVLLDIHALPGSQNKWNHAMSSGPVNWLYGVMGLANAQRSLEVVRTLTEFASQEEYKDVITMVSLVNEVVAAEIGFNTLLS
jgi:glucan 1,3-beta-glucosidase